METKVKPAVKKKVNPEDKTKKLGSLVSGMDSDANYQAFLKTFTYDFPAKQHGELFNDFLDYTLWFLHKPFESAGCNKEVIENGLRLDKVYKKSDGVKFAGMFNAFINASENNGEGLRDVLGDLFMDLVSHGKNGQFFTPQHICDMMALMVGGEDTGRKVEYIADPACGSGRMMLGMEKVRRGKISDARPNGGSPQTERKFKYFNADIDAACCKMCVINMLLNGLSGEVAHMNSLSLEYHKSYHVFNIGVPHFVIKYDKASSMMFGNVERDEGLREGFRATIESRKAYSVIDMLNYKILK